MTKPAWVLLAGWETMSLGQHSLPQHDTKLAGGLSTMYLSFSKSSGFGLTSNFTQ
jgi:hypothetical protein